MLIPAQNVEAYQTIGEILMSLREATRLALVSSFGERWFDTAISRELFARLTARKDREKSVNAYNGDYFTMIEYADFLDLAEIHAQQPGTAGFLQPVLPNSQVRQTRMIELQSLFEKLAGMRDVNEAELSFLRNFSNRLAGVVGALPETKPDRTVWARSQAPAASPAPTPSPGPPAFSTPPLEVRPAPPVVAAPKPEEQIAALVASQAPHSAKPAATGASSVPVFRPAPSAPAPAQRSGPPAPEPAPAPAGHDESPDIDSLLGKGDDRAVVEALYHEVLSLSESLMSSAGPRRPKIWEKVSESDWYSKRFSALGLRPVSDYYDLYLAASDQLRSGVTRAHLQDFLQAHSYSQVVLAMGSFFQQRRGPHR